jgi:hypothetical protein
MNGIGIVMVSLGAVILLGVICTFLVYLTDIKEDLWEPIWESLKSEDNEL